MNNKFLLITFLCAGLSVFMPMVAMEDNNPCPTKGLNLEEDKEKLTGLMDLPDELFLYILSQLTDLKDIVHIAKANRRCAGISRTDILTPEESEQIKTYFNELENIDCLTSLKEKNHVFMNCVRGNL